MKPPGPAPRDTPEVVAAIRALVELGTRDEGIAAALKIALKSVTRYRHRHGIPAGRDVLHARAPKPEPERRPSLTAAQRAELITAARPWAQRSWSAKGGA